MAYKHRVLNTATGQEELHDPPSTSIPNDSVTNAMLAPDVKVGSLASLLTTAQSNIVAAINEVFGMIVTYIAGDGIQIFGTTISADVDNVSTALVAGEIVVKDGGVTAAKLGTGAVETAKLADGSVTAAKLATGVKPRLLVDYILGSTSAVNLAASTFNAVSDPDFRRIVNLAGIDKVRVYGWLFGHVAATKIRIQYSTTADPAISTSDGSWTTLADTAGSHPALDPFYSAELSVPVGAQINNVQIRVGLYDGDGAADPYFIRCHLNFYAS